MPKLWRPPSGSRIAGAGMVIVIGCAGDKRRARPEHRPRRVGLGLGNAVPLGRADMSFTMAGSVLLLGLLAGIGPRRYRCQERAKATTQQPTFDGW
jgi:hypothetical protein